MLRFQPYHPLATLFPGSSERRLVDDIALIGREFIVFDHDRLG
jgi:hypothetical protein